jgi:hypothetical protein
MSIIQMRKLKKDLTREKVKTTVITALANDMADYLSHECEDYFEQCREQEKDPYTIDAGNTWHIYQNVLIYWYFTGVELDPQFKFISTKKVNK